jgi:hypothetical protein
VLALRSTDEMYQLRVGRPPTAARGAGHQERPRSRGSHSKREEMSAILVPLGSRVTCFP